jgi:hypothetical protein
VPFSFLTTPTSSVQRQQDEAFFLPSQRLVQRFVVSHFGVSLFHFLEKTKREKNTAEAEEERREKKRYISKKDCLTEI